MRGPGTSRWTPRADAAVYSASLKEIPDTQKSTAQPKKTKMLLYTIPQVCVWDGDL